MKKDVMAVFHKYQTLNKMTESRYYKKDNLEKAPLEIVENKKVNSIISNASVVSTPNAAYTKPEASILPKAYIVIFFGGTKREKDYFNLIRINHTFYPDIKIDFIPEPDFEQGGKPKITQLAIVKTKEYKESANDENPDSFYLLTDVDHFEQFLLEMKKECNENGIELIISNSCFEVWLYYSEKSDKCEGFNIPNDKDKISSAFKTWANKQVKGGLKPTKAVLNIEQNISNAQNNYSEQDGLPTLFSTQMFRLAEKMLTYVKEGNEKILRNQRKTRK